MRHIGAVVASVRRLLVLVGTWLAAQVRWAPMRAERIPATAAAQALRQYALGAIGRQAFDRSVARLARRRR